MFAYIFPFNKNYYNHILTLGQVLDIWVNLHFIL